MAERRQVRGEQGYEPLRKEDRQDDDDAGLPESRRPTPHWLRTMTTPGNPWQMVSAAMALVWVVTTAGLIWQLRSHRPTTHRLDASGYICAPNGAIPDVARARGCEFDGLSFHWFPKEHTEDKDNLAILREFQEHGPWLRYLDKEGKYPIPPDNLVLTSAYLTRREHIIHCKYALRQTHLWVTKGWDLPFNYNHTLHCTAYLVDTIMCVTIISFFFFKIQI
jgi:hypothetical protein